MTGTHDVVPAIPSTFLDVHQSGSAVTRLASIPIEDAEATDLRRKLASLPVIDRPKAC